MSFTDALARTVLGDVRSTKLGIVLPHEHVMVDTREIWGLQGDVGVRVTKENRDEVRNNLMAFPDCLVLDDPELAGSELLAFKACGGGGVADLTPEGCGRYPAKLVSVAQLTGLHVIAGCGPYVERAHPPRLKTLSVDDVALELIRDVVVGIDGTKVRAGIIGEIGTSDPVTDDEKKVLAAAAIAQKATGCAITIHVHMGARTGHTILSTIEDAGGDLSRVVLGHLDVLLSDSFQPDTAVEHHMELADRGCYIEFDLCGFEEFVQLATGQSYRHPRDEVRAEAIKRLVEQGYAKQVLLSHDVCKKIQLQRFGGLGYAHTLSGFKDRLLAHGLTREVLHQIYELNPQEVFSINPGSPIFSDDYATAELPDYRD